MSTVWEQIAAPLPAEAISWRQDGRPAERQGKFFARFVAYVDAQFVRERLDAVVPGSWALSLELLPALTSNGDGEALDEPCAFKAKLTVDDGLGHVVTREDVGMGRDYKQAATDAFKRAAVRFGIAHELYSYEQNWVQVDGEGKFAKPVEDPGEAYARKIGRGTEGATSKAPVEGRAAARPETTAAAGKAASTPPAPVDSTDDVTCPKCGGRMFDNRLSKRNPKAPDYKCRSRSCDGVIWPPRAAAPSRNSTSYDDGPPPDNDLDELPF